MMRGSATHHSVGAKLRCTRFCTDDDNQHKTKDALVRAATASLAIQSVLAAARPPKTHPRTGSWLLGLVV